MNFGHLILTPFTCVKISFLKNKFLVNGKNAMHRNWLRNRRRAQPRSARVAPGILADAEHLLLVKRLQHPGQRLQRPAERRDKAVDGLVLQQLLQRTASLLRLLVPLPYCFFFIWWRPAGQSAPGGQSTCSAWCCEACPGPRAGTHNT